MAGTGARSRWRDAMALTLLAVVIIFGLVYYGDGAVDEEPNDRATTSAVHNSAGPEPTPSATETVTETAQPTPAPTSEPPSPSPSAEPRSATCWDGRATTSLRVCGLPDGARGLEYVFPSFAASRPLCRPAQTDADSYAVVLAFECFDDDAAGRSVTILYEQVADPQKVNDWMLQRLGRVGLHEVKGGNGGRTVYTDNRNFPYRYAVGYNRFPYLVSVFAGTPQASRQAFDQLVTMRPESRIRGRRDS